jgi:hypothetical protein
VASLERIALEHQRRQAAQARKAATEARKLWALIDQKNIGRSWTEQLARLFTAVSGAQQLSAAASDEYVDEALAAQGVSGAASGTVRADALAGVASDGRSLASLLYQPAITSLQAIGAGAAPARALTLGQVHLDMIVRTQVADAGRVADGMAITARPHATGYIRLVSAGACSRCIVLAGKHYAWNKGFLRHPRCHCRNVPAAEDHADDVRTDPHRYFDSLSPAEQDKTFTVAGAQAIRDGSDIGQVVNGRRGMSSAGGRLTTTEATTRRGIAGKQLRAANRGRPQPQRLMPEEIYKVAGEDRNRALQLLHRNGYLTEKPTPATVFSELERPVIRPAQPVRVVRPAKPLFPKPVAPPATVKALTLADRVKAGIVDRQVLSGGKNARTELLTLADGSKVVFKAAKVVQGRSARSQQDAEELVPMVLRAAGVRAPEIYRPSANQVYMEHFDGVIANTYRMRGSFKIDPTKYDEEQWLLMGLVDQITYNYDRHGGNWLIGADKSVLPIDHGFAFSFFNGVDLPLLDNDEPIGAFHVQDGPWPVNEWAENDMSRLDIGVLRDRLLKLLPEFERVGRAGWWDGMMTRLEHIGDHAVGTKRRLT